jgi:hypothetical protein
VKKRKKIGLLVVSILFVSSCHNKGESVTKNSSIQNAIEGMEKQGELPILDRSHDVKGNEDQNGVRHDINVWIHKQPYDDKGLKALTQVAKALQMDITSHLSDMDKVTAKKTAKALSDEEERAVHCIWNVFGEKSGEYIHKLEQFTVNTKERLSAYSQYAHSLNGEILDGATGDTCEK